MAILVAWYIAITALAVFQCSPVQKQFDYTIPGHCLSFYGTFIGVTAPNLFHRRCTTFIAGADVMES